MVQVMRYAGHALVTRRQAENAGISRATLQRLATESVLERVAHGVYHLKGAPMPDHLGLRAAWLQLAPDVPAWERTPEQGVVYHRSAAALYGLGDLPADRNEFTVPSRRQSRQSDIRLHTRRLEPHEHFQIAGMSVTRPSRIASDLLYDREGPDAVAQIVADAIRRARNSPGAFVDALAPHATKFGLRRGDGFALLHWLLDLIGDRDTAQRLQEARQHVPNTFIGRHTSQPGARREAALVSRRESYMPGTGSNSNTSMLGSGECKCG